MKQELSKEGREDLAFALILLRDFKCQGKFDIDVILGIYKFAKFLGVSQELEDLTLKIPPMKIEPRYP